MSILDLFKQPVFKQPVCEYCGDSDIVYSTFATMCKDCSTCYLRCAPEYFDAYKNGAISMGELIQLRDAALAEMEKKILQEHKRLRKKWGLDK